MATHFFWDPIEDNIVQERDDAGAITAEYATEPYLYGNLISQNRGGVESQYHFDPQGSTLALTDDYQQVTDTYAYSAFGEVIDHTGSTLNPFQYVGQKQYYWDAEAGGHYVRQRPLSVEDGRWLSADLIRLSNQDANLYVYAASGPTKFVDPSGLVPIDVSVPISPQCGFKRPPEISPTRICAFDDKYLNGYFGTSWAFGVEFVGIANCCNCCEFRQYVRGYQKLRINDGPWHMVKRWGIQPNPMDVQINPTGWPGYEEDLLADVKTPYGHRDGVNTFPDNYKNQRDADDRKTGCRYRMKDSPGLTNIHEQINVPGTKKLEIEILNQLGFLWVEA